MCETIIQILCRSKQYRCQNLVSLLSIPLYPVKTTRLANTAMLIVIDAINKLIKKPFNCSNIP